MPLDPPVTARALALVFAVHNVEEFAHFRQDRARALARVPAGSRIEEWYRPDGMAVALLLLTGLAGGLLSLPGEEPDRAADGVALAGSAALAFNAVTHVGRAVAERRYNGGLLTAPLMFATAVALRRGIDRRSTLPRRARAALTGVGVAAVPALIAASLEAGRRLTTRTGR
jgi:hypothetical protein